MSNIIINGAQVVADASQAIADPQGWRIGATIYPTLAGFSLVDTGAPLPSPFIPRAWVWSGGALTANSGYSPSITAAAIAAGANAATSSYNSALQRKAAQLAKQGQTAQATSLYLKAAGVLK